MGTPWWSNSYNSVLSLLRAWFQSLVWKLISHNPCSMAKEIKNKNKIKMYYFIWIKERKTFQKLIMNKKTPTEIFSTPQRHNSFHPTRERAKQKKAQHSKSLHK